MQQLNAFSCSCKVAFLQLIFYIIFCHSAFSQIYPVREWKLTNGCCSTGAFFSAGTGAVVLRQNNTNVFLLIDHLSVADQIYVYECKTNTMQARLKQDAAWMRAQGYTEFTANLIKSFPEKARSKGGWMDVEFVRFDEDAGRTPTLDLGFDVRDNAGNLFLHCCTCKSIFGPHWPYNINDQTPNPYVNVIARLKAGDRLRLYGTTDAGEAPDYTSNIRFMVDRIQIIESDQEHANYAGLRDKL